MPQQKVGGATGCGLSGGQKKRLVVALQLLNLPSVIFLDEANIRLVWRAVVSRVSTHGHLTITCYICPCGRLPWRKIACIAVFSLTPNLVHGRLPGMLWYIDCSRTWLCITMAGLDASASYELLTHLNKLAYSNRTVILTIHQPRLEIFHMFHQLVLLSDGKVRLL